MGLLDKFFGGSKSTAYPSPVSDVDFEEKVLHSELPVVVEFSTTTCPSCHVMLGLLKELASEYDGRLNVFTMNANYCPETAHRFQIMGVPTLITFNRKRAVGRVQGLVPLGDIRGLFEELASGRD